MDAFASSLLRFRMAHLSRHVSAAHVRLGAELGKGQFKRVQKGRYKGKDVAAIIFKEGSLEKELILLLRLASRGPRFVPEVFGTCVLSGGVCVLQELARCGTLKQCIVDTCTQPLHGCGDPFTLAHRLTAMTQAARALAFLEGERVVHADLSCRNLLVFRADENPAHTVVKLSDLGLSIELAEPTACAEDEAAPGFVVLSARAACDRMRQPRAVRWSSPETICEHKLSHRADAWSLGATIWEALSAGQNPWACSPRRADVDSQLRALAQAERDGPAIVAAAFPRPRDCPASVHDVVLACLRVDEFARPAFELVAEGLQKSAEALCRTVVLDGEEWVFASATASL